MTAIAFFLLRLAIGVSMFGHGLVRLPKLPVFSKWMVGNFESSILPRLVVLPFSYFLPVAEFTVGTLLLIGLFTKPALIAGGIIMILLLFGTSMIENWEAIPSQLIHAFFFCFLLNYVQHNSWAIDNLFSK